MPIFNIHLTTPIRRTFRTEQVAGLFDLALDDLAGERLAHTLTAELPGFDENWTIGAIVGPSGSGKTTLARAAYGDAVYEPQPWPEDVAVIDALEDPASGRRKPPDGFDSNRTQPHRGANAPRSPIPLKDLLRTLAAVGLASPPSWLRPYRTLSTGERFRADLARAILASGVRKLPDSVAPTTNPCHREADTSRSPSSLLVFDEFTSTLDRTVACTASHTLGKYLRSSASNPQFVCLSCHTDFLPWLAPDWILDLESRSLTPSGISGRDDVAWRSTLTGMENRAAAQLPHGVRELQGESRSLTPSGISGRDDVARRSTSTGVERARAAQLPHGVRELLRPHWPRGSLQRPELRLRVRRVPQRLWPRFARHHYLSGGLSSAATCYAAFVGHASRLSPTLDNRDGCPTPERPIAFCAVVATLGWKRSKRITRLVVLPEFQGLGIGPRLAEAVAAAEAAKGHRVTITASHPSVLAWCAGSPRWSYLGLKKTGSTRQQFGSRTIRCSTGRAVASFEFIREGKAPA